MSYNLSSDQKCKAIFRRACWTFCYIRAAFTYYIHSRSASHPAQGHVRHTPQPKTQPQPRPQAQAQPQPQPRPQLRREYQFPAGRPPGLTAIITATTLLVPPRYNYDTITIHSRYNPRYNPRYNSKNGTFLKNSNRCGDEQ